MKIAILGATGLVGQALAVHLLRGGTLRPGDTLELCGHGTASTELRLFAERADLLDAFDECEVSIAIDNVFDEVVADIIVVACGATLDASHPQRTDLTQANRPVFEQIASRCAARLPKAAFVVVSNPVELAVDILSRATSRHRVLGMGAHQDTLRFGRTVAEALGLSRRDVRALVLGEHGSAMVPLWSSVEVLEADTATHERLAALRQRCTLQSLAERTARLRAEVAPLADRHALAAAYERLRTADPDTRIFVEPFVTRACLHSTTHATANATAQVIAAMLAGDGRRIAGQVRLEGEAWGIFGTVGVPLELVPSGWRLGALPALSDAESAALKDSAAAIARGLHGP